MLAQEQIDRCRAALRAAMGKRGKYFNRLKARPPKWGTDGNIMWHAAMLVVNPYKVSIGAMMLCSDQEFRGDCIKYIEDYLTAEQRAGLDLDRQQLTALGVW